jgi:D-arabinose 1-dehydrogenase-like Zn-dependent alcohol dehydrogenase
VDEAEMTVLKFIARYARRDCRCTCDDATTRTYIDGVRSAPARIKPTPMKEEPMADVQKWIDELRAGKVVGRIVLKN